MDKNCLGSITNLKDILPLFSAEELIFCSKDVDFQEIINYLNLLKGQYRFKILNDKMDIIIGSSSKMKKEIGMEMKRYSSYQTLLNNAIKDY